MSSAMLRANQRSKPAPSSRAVKLAQAEDRSRNTLKGYLRKKSSKGSWQRRWFEASAHYLTYYKTAESDKILACIDLARVGEIKLVNVSPGGGPYEFSIELDKRVYIMKAKTFADAKRWVDGLNLIQRRSTGSRHSRGTGASDVTLSVDRRSAGMQPIEVDGGKAKTGVEKPGERAKTRSCFCCC